MKLKHTEDYFIRSLLNKVKLKEIMTKTVVTINENEPFSHVAQRFNEFNIRHLPVVNNKGILKGIITQRDLYRVCPPRKDQKGKWIWDTQALDSYILKHAMIKQVCTLSSTHTVAQALLIMADRKYGCIPIVDSKNKICGIITQLDILKIGAQILKEGDQAKTSKG